MNKSKEECERELQEFFDKHINPNVNYLIVRGDSYPRVRVGTLKVVNDFVISSTGAFWYYEDFKRVLLEKEGGAYRRKIFRADQEKEAANYIKWCFRRLIESQKEEVKDKREYLKRSKDFLQRLQDNYKDTKVSIDSDIIKISIYEEEI